MSDKGIVLTRSLEGKTVNRPRVKLPYVRYGKSGSTVLTNCAHQLPLRNVYFSRYGSFEVGIIIIMMMIIMITRGGMRNDGAVTRRHYARFTGAMRWNSFLMLFRFWNGLIEWPSLCFLVKWRRDCTGSSVDLCVSLSLHPLLFVPFLRNFDISVFYSWKINLFDRRIIRIY